MARDDRTKFQPTDAEFDRVTRLVSECRKLDFPDTPKRPGDWQEAHVACRDELDRVLATARDMRELIAEMWERYGYATAVRSTVNRERVRFFIGERADG
jgi:hypothetical protein